MRLYILILFVLFSFSLQGQHMLLAGGGEEAAPPVGDLLLDNYPGAAAAYSLRELSTAWAGQPVIRVRESGGNTEQDFTAAEITDGTLTTFCGANNGFVVTWYDQSGNDNDVTQSTAANQPKIYDGTTGLISKNGKASIEFNGINTYLFGGSTELLNTGNPFALFIVLNEDGTPNNNGMFSISSNQINSFGAFINASASYLPFTLVATSGFYRFKGFGSRKIMDQQLFGVLFDGVDYTDLSSYDFSVDGVDVGSTGAGSVLQPNTNELRIGRANADYVGSYWLGKYQEFIIYSSNQSANRTGIETNINTYYSIY